MKESNKFSKNFKVFLIDMNEVNSVLVVKMVEFMFKNFIEMNVLDIYIELFENEVRIRYRIDGKLKIINIFGIESLGIIVIRIKIFVGFNIVEKRIL